MTDSLPRVEWIRIDMGSGPMWLTWHGQEVQHAIDRSRIAGNLVFSYTACGISTDLDLKMPGDKLARCNRCLRRTKEGKA
jgi:hypothetical protein